MTKVLVIPFDDRQPVRTEDIDDSSDALNKLVFGEEGGPLDIKTFMRQRTQMAYDDLGLYNQPQNVNRRAMKLWAHLAGQRMENFVQNLVGNYVVFGLDPFEGETEDVTQEVLDFFSEEGQL